MKKSQNVTVLLALTVFAALAGCGGGDYDNTDNQQTGYRGIVQEILPSGEIIRRPGAIVGAAEEYVAGDQISYGGEVARTVADANGEFFLPLPPGRYAASIISVSPNEERDDTCSYSIRIANLQQGQVENANLTISNCR
ncbi:MAG: hypothetical protein H7Y38_20445 [Armatimonadetes bacterium]|nr:hypothetical protein [Armatimonadota bacterium]